MAGYPVPARETQVELGFRNSRFIGTVGGAETVGAARDFIDRVRRRYSGASHHVYAFAVGYGATVTHGMSDAGEPPGTAGRPTLAVVQGADLGDVVLVTTRFFGGTKLGTGGLVRAYTATAQQALAATPRKTRVVPVCFQLELTYELYEPCRKVLEDQGVAIEDESFAGTVCVRAACPRDKLEQVRTVLSETTSGRVTLSVVD